MLGTLGCYSILSIVTFHYTYMPNAQDDYMLATPNDSNIDISNIPLTSYRERSQVKIRSYFQNFYALLHHLSKNEVAAKQDIQTEDTSSYSSFFEVSEYTFPSVQERLEYYMGDWYNTTEWNVPDCNLVKEQDDYNKVADQDVLLTSNVIKECMESGSKLGITYCVDAYSFINTTEVARRNDAHWLVRFGFQDRLTKLGNQLPVISKARPSIVSHYPQPIIWLLNKNRHYDELHLYHQNILEKEMEIPWSVKLPKVFWRGSTTGNRANDAGNRLAYLTQWVHHNSDQTDIAFNNVVQMRSNFKHKYIERHYSRKVIGGPEGRESLINMSRYKYLLSVEGNDVATGLKWMLYSNSVVFMSRPTVATWAMEDLLVPFVHYIPLASDYSNLLEMVKWAEDHDEACKEISKRATEFIEHLWTSEQAKEDTKYLQKELATAYVNQFDSALSQCTVAF